MTTTGERYTPRRAKRCVRHLIRGIDYNLTHWGNEGDPLFVILHGWGDTGSTFQFVVDALEHDWHVVAPDWRGFGLSAHAPGGYWFPDYLADLDALLDRLSPDAPVALVGHSMGANVAGLYSGVMPHRVQTFVNIEGFGLTDSDPDNAPAHYSRWIDMAKRPPKYSTYASFDEIVPRIVKRSPRIPLERAHFVAREWAARDGDGVIRLRADAAHKLPNAVPYHRDEALACWRRIEADILLVIGAETRFQSAAHDWVSAGGARSPFPNAQLQSIEGAGHMIHFEAAQALAAVIERCLRQTRSTP